MRSNMLSFPDLTDIPDPLSPCAYPVCDDQDRIGVVHEWHGLFFAYDADLEFIGEFETQNAAIAAVPKVSGSLRKLALRAWQKARGHKLEAVKLLRDFTDMKIGLRRAATVIEETDPSKRLH
jgi:hypothetical protein